VTPHLADEIAALEPDGSVSAYRIAFTYAIFGRPLRGGLYPPTLALFRRERARYVQSGHTQRLAVDGRIETLRGKIVHDDRKPLRRWFDSQRKYAALEAEYLLNLPGSELKTAQRLRLTGWAAPLAMFVYVLLVKRCFLDGWPGWFYVLQRTLAELMVALEIIDRRLSRIRQT
jgi:hypothetical protein